MLRWGLARMVDAEVALMRLGRSQSQAGFQMHRLFLCLAVCVHRWIPYGYAARKKVSSVLCLFLHYSFICTGPPFDSPLSSSSSPCLEALCSYGVRDASRAQLLKQDAVPLCH